MSPFLIPDGENLTAEQKAETFADMVGEACAYADHVFGGTNARFAVVAWIDGHCDSIDGIAVGAHPEGKGEVRQALAFAAEWAKDNVGGPSQ
jgi:hypothetical protein